MFALQRRIMVEASSTLDGVIFGAKRQAVAHLPSVVSNLATFGSLHLPF